MLGLEMRGLEFGDERVRARYERVKVRDERVG